MHYEDGYRCDKRPRDGLNKLAIEKGMQQMRTSFRRLLVATAVLAVSSCTAQAAPQMAPSVGKAPTDRPLPKNRSCQDGKFHWGKVTRKDTLIAASDAHREHIPAGRTATFTYTLVPIRTLKSGVTPPRANDAISPQKAVTALEKETGLDLAKAGTTFTLGPEDKTLETKSGKSSGVIVATVSIETVEAPFLYGCGSEKDDVRGTLTTWQPAPYTSLIKCGIKDELSRPEVEAEALMCGQRNSD
ncbi:hypothetical protein ACIQ7S_17205 [Streptomyces griseoluteus]|uniref:hypothetical protein n=1 Tax=Streptomyces griseoluteus TaxID=29306 RepID=UPI0033345761